LIIIAPNRKIEQTELKLEAETRSRNWSNIHRTVYNWIVLWHCHSFSYRAYYYGIRQSCNDGCL